MTEIFSARIALRASNYLFSGIVGLRHRNYSDVFSTMLDSPCYRLLLCARVK
jgi:hypothetical protein